MNPWLRVLAPFAAGYYFSYLLRNVNAVIAPELTRELGVSAADLGLLTSAYLLAFGAFQLPLGLLLDRFGPRRVETALLLVAATGCALFAGGGDLQELAVARAAIGLGVSACLMGSFKAFSLWFPPARLPALNAAVMAAGSLGAVSATLPLSWALTVTDWRGLFLLLAGLGLLAAAGIFTTPEKPAAAARESFAELLRALAGIFKSRAFWRYVPQNAIAVGGFMAIQGLWAVPWLMAVDGYDRDAAAFHVMLSAAAMLAGFLAIALSVTRLASRGIAPERILAAGMGAGVFVMALIVLDLGATPVLWFALGLVFAVGNLAYALLCAHFPPQLTGRVNTALNLGAFVGAFSLQWGIGVAIDALQAHGLPPRDAFRWAFGGLTLLQGLSWLWFVAGGRRS